MTYDPAYLDSRYRSYDERAVRYRAVAKIMAENGLTEDSTVLDLGGGDAEMEKCLREEFGWKGQYTNYDFVTGHDLYDFYEGDPGTHDFVVSLETVEHLTVPFVTELMLDIRFYARKAVVLTTPDSEAQDVYAMDETHVSAWSKGELEALGYIVTRETLYDGYYSDGKPDGLVAHIPLSVLG